MDTITIDKGRVLIYRLFDVAHEIDLSMIERTAGEGAKRLRFSRTTYMKALQFANPPISFELSPFTIPLFEKDTKVGVIAKAYDLGVVSIAFDVPIPPGTTLNKLEEVTRELDADRSIEARALEYVTRLLASLGGAVISPEIKEGFVEDYMVIYVEGLGGGLCASEFLSLYDPSRLLLYEGRELSESTKSETLKHRFSYYPDDLIIVHIDNAFIIDPSGSSDLPDILEFANAQIFELRYYDNVMDNELKAIYGELSAGGGVSFFRLREYERLARKITRIVTDMTEVTGKVDNALKVTEDVYYARIYSTFMSLLRSGDWEESIKEKLDIVMDTYKMLHDEISAKRAYAVELGIFLLIVVEMFLVFFRK